MVTHKKYLIIGNQVKKDNVVQCYREIRDRWFVIVKVRQFRED